MEPPTKRAKVVHQNGNSVPVLGREEFMSRLEKFRKEKCSPIAAMYSSVVGGIVADPVLMTIPIDDHMVVRGHAVFEAHAVVNGRLFRLDQHLDRLFKSARMARISWPFGFGDDEKANRAHIVSIVAQTVVASGMRNCAVRMFLSVGPGNFGITPEGCTPAFYVVVLEPYEGVQNSGLKAIKEVTVAAETIPMKPGILARTKTNNYLLNALSAMHAREKGGRDGIGVDAKGYVTESAIGSVAFVTTDRRFVTPKFDNILAGTTVKKLMQCAQKLVTLGVLKAVSQEDILASEAKKWPEALLTGGDTEVEPITHWDGEAIGTGEIGEVTRKIAVLLKEQAESDDNPDDHYILSYPDV